MANGKHVQKTEEILFIRRSQAAALAGVSDRTISRWADAGKIKWKHDDDGRLLVDRGSLDVVDPTDELDDNRENVDKIVGHATLLLGQAYDHLQKRDAEMGKLSKLIVELHGARDQHTVDAIDRLSKENSSVHRENEKLRREVAKLETEAAAEVFDSDAHIRNEDRKDRLMNSVVGAIQHKLGVSDESKEVVEAVTDAMKQE